MEVLKLSKSIISEYNRHTHIPFEYVKDSPYQIRQDYGDIEGLARNILENGLKNPIKVWAEPDSNGDVEVDGSLYTIYAEDGHRRRRAFNHIIQHHPNHPILAKGLKVIFTPKAPPVERILSQYTYNNTGLPYNALEELELFKLLEKYDYTKEDIAKKTGRSIAHIYNVFRLQEYSEDILALIRAGRLSSTYAIELLRNNSDIKQTEEKILEVAKTESKITKAKVNGKERKRVKPSEVISGEVNAKDYLGNISDRKLLELIYSSIIICHRDTNNDKLLQCLIPETVLDALDNRINDKPTK